MSYDVFTKDGRPAGKLTVTRMGPRTVFEYQSDFDPGVSRLVLISGGVPRSLGIPSQRAGGLYLHKAMTRLDLGGMEPDGEAAALLVPAEEDITGLASKSAPAPAPEAVENDAMEDEPVTPPEAEDAAPAEEDPARAEEEEPGDGAEEKRGAASMPVPAPAAAPRRGTEWRDEPEPGKYFADPELQSSASRISGALIRETEDGVVIAFPWTPSSPFPMLEIFRLCSSVTIDGAEYISYRLKNGKPI